MRQTKPSGELRNVAIHGGPAFEAGLLFRATRLPTLIVALEQTRAPFSAHPTGFNHEQPSDLDSELE